MAEKEDAMIPPCKTCKWMKYHGRLDRLFGTLGMATCHQPEIGPRALTVDPVSGKIDTRRWEICSVNRMHSGACGFDGQFWEMS